MTDISHFFGGDLILGANGDLLVVSGDAETQQRILRRLLTNAGDYLWHLAYGAGVGARVGHPTHPSALQGLIRSQIFAEASVAQAPEPIITTTVSQDGTVVCNISYTDATTGGTSVLTFPIGQ